MCKNDTVDLSACVTTVGFDVFKKTIVLEDGQTTVVSTPWSSLQFAGARLCVVIWSNEISYVN